jgi:hypothetical protein
MGNISPFPDFNHNSLNVRFRAFHMKVAFGSVPEIYQRLILVITKRRLSADSVEKLRFWQ